MTKYLFSIPDSITVRLLNRCLLTAMGAHPEWFYQDFKIETVYGVPSSCCWSGNRFNAGEEYDAGWADAVFGLYAEAGIRYRLIFTNFLLRREHLRDPIGNQVALALSRRGGGSAMVSTMLMYQYLARYPGLERCWSTTTDFGHREEDRIRRINQLSERSPVVLPYEFNNRWPELERMAHPERLEVLLNEDCIDNCPRRREHWTNVCREALRDGSGGIYTGCLVGASPGLEARHRVHRGSLDDYVKRRITHFKISGRQSKEQTLQAYLDYFVSPAAGAEFRGFYENYKVNFRRMVNSAGRL